MDTNVILAIVITLIIVVPVAILATAGKRKHKKSLSQFVDFAKSKNLQLDEYECCECLVIGLDNKSRKIVYKLNSNDAQVVDISQLKSCAYKVNSEINDGDYIDKLEMDLEYKDNKVAKNTLTFFTSANKLNLDNERQIIEKWQQKISSLIA